MENLKNEVAIKRAKELKKLSKRELINRLLRTELMLDRTNELGGDSLYDYAYEYDYEMRVGLDGYFPEEAYSLECLKDLDYAESIGRSLEDEPDFLTGEAKENVLKVYLEIQEAQANYKSKEDAELELKHKDEYSVVSFVLEDKIKDLDKNGLLGYDVPDLANYNTDSAISRELSTRMEIDFDVVLIKELVTSALTKKYGIKFKKFSLI